MTNPKPSLHQSALSSLKTSLIFSLSFLAFFTIGTYYLHGSVSYLGQEQQSASTVDITIKSDKPTYVVGEDIKATVTLTSLTEKVIGVDVEVKFDPTKLSFVSGTNAGFLPTTLSAASAKSGLITMSLGSDFGNAKQGTGIIINLNLKTLTAGQTKLELTPEIRVVTQGFSENRLQTTTDATLTITSGTTPTTSPTPSLKPSVSPNPSTKPSPTNTLTPTPTPVISNGFNAEYFTNTALTGQPTTTKNDNEINFNWGTKSPIANFPANNFSVRWTKTVTLSAGTYEFTTKHDDGMRIFVDSTRIYNRWGAQSARTRSFIRQITQGNHVIKVEYYEQAGSAEAAVSWIRTGN